MIQMRHKIRLIEIFMSGKPRVPNNMLNELFVLNNVFAISNVPVLSIFVELAC